MNTSGENQTAYGSYIEWLIMNQLQNNTVKINQTLWLDINDYHKSIAKDIGVHDFYSLHVLDMCSGWWGKNSSNHASSYRDVLYCSPRHGLSTPRFTGILITELSRSSLKLDIYKDIHWPGIISRQIKQLRFAYRAMGATYFLSMAATGAALIGSVIGLVTNGRLSAMLNIGLSLLAFLSLTIASACATAVMTKTVNIINEHANKIDVNATRGGRFLAMTWIASVLSLIAALAWEGELGFKLVRGSGPKPVVHDESIEHIKE